MAKKKTLYIAYYCTNKRDGKTCNSMNYTEARTEHAEKERRQDKEKGAGTSADLKNKYCAVCRTHTPHKGKRVHKAQPK